MAIMAEWANFFVAIVSAAAALTGLIFVGVSISLSKVLEVPQLPDRALESIILLLAVLITAALCLVPAQGFSALGCEILGMGAIIWAASTYINTRILLTSAPQYKMHAVRNMFFSQASVLPYIIAGITVLVHGLPDIYWLIPAFIFSFCKSVLDAWVLLVEIHR